VAKEQLKRKNAETQTKDEVVEDKSVDSEDARTLRELRAKKQNILDSLSRLQKKQKKHKRPLMIIGQYCKNLWILMKLLMNLLGNH